MLHIPGYITDAFLPVSLQELDAVALQRRFESKYLFREVLLPAILAQLQPYYRMLDIGGSRSFDYLTWYFDTPDFRLYRDHHNGYARRMKIRQRRYEQSGEVFFEIKRKASEMQTDKSRFRIPALQPALQPEWTAGVAERLEGKALQYKLSNRFRRITLCNHSRTERVTIDTGIGMSKGMGGAEMPIGPVVLMELKQLKPDPRSPAFLLMKKEHIFETSFSKYAVGTALLYTGLKNNNLKPVFLKLQQYAAG
jgi:hypothetical protein